MYYPQSPYEFSVLSSEILGQVYEQFLGKVIRLTAGHRAVVEDKPEVRKAGGVYYTPTYIVDYIVKRTVGKLLEGRTPRQADRLKILDPACGSGSFLLGAYQVLHDWYRDRYFEDGVGMHTKRLYQAAGGAWRLTTAEKKRILLNSIFGVDIDPQAVEVTKLSLFLKVLEGESQQTLQTQLRLFHERALPDLAGNIKCGNSLIGPDFYRTRQMEFLTEEERYRINVFDWNTAFPWLAEVGGFDAVIGNPPYVDVKLLGEEIKQALAERYVAATRRFDLYVPFMEKGLRLLRDLGLLGFIVPSMFMRREYGRDLRKVTSELSAVEDVVDFGTNQIFICPFNYVAILTLRRSGRSDECLITVVERAGLRENDLKQALSGPTLPEGVKRFSVSSAVFASSSEWYFLGKQQAQLLKRLTDSHPSLETVLAYASEGIHSGKDEVFFVPLETARSLKLETPPAFPLAKGKDVHRYAPIIEEDLANLVIYPYDLSSGALFSEDVLAETAPHAWEYLLRSRKLLKGRPYFEKSRKRWYELWCPRTPALYTSPKILGPGIACRGEFTLCGSRLFINNKLKAIILREGVLERLEYLLGLLNSTLIVTLYRSIAPPKGGNFFEVKTGFLGKLPFRTIDFSDPTDKRRHDRMVELVQEILALQRKLPAAKTPYENTAIQAQVTAIDGEIDHLVYELYGLTDEETRIAGAANQ